jgi:hypothetical protein
MVSRVDIDRDKPTPNYPQMVTIWGVVLYDNNTVCLFNETFFGNSLNAKGFP